MTFVDSADSILMLYSYAGFPERGLAIFERHSSLTASEQPSSLRSVHSDLTALHATSTSGPNDAVVPAAPAKRADTPEPILLDLECNVPNEPRLSDAQPEDNHQATIQKRTLEQATKNTMSGLSIILTLLSILVAFR